ncbi:MAG: DUF222 domain-containing protein [Oleispira antarctica]|nr:DUF222 domain-containing protein [Oleispira antarctica]MBQ0793173.1 DUF222 domain-containing protein [Oleispira antarctica]
MYALKVEKYFSSDHHKNCVDCIRESSNDSYQPSLDNLEESNDQLADRITTLAGQINAATYRFLKLIAEFDRRNAWSGYGLRSCAHWLSWKCSIDMGSAREKVRVARALEELPAINAAFERGELSFSKVRAMTRAATDINESYLLMIAEYGTTQQMETLVKSFRTVSRIEKFDVTANNDADLGTSEEKKELNQQQFEQEARSVSCYQDDEGMWIIKARLPAEEGALVAKALQALGDSIADAKKREVDDESAENNDKNVSAETEMETFSFGSLIENEEEKEEEKLTFPQRRADALVAMTEHYLASGSDGSQGLSSLKGAERCQLVMHVRADSHNIGVNNDASLDGRWLLPNAARRLACDASLLVVHEDNVGNVLDIGRKTRVIPPAMARVLAIRDSGCCQFPGCCETRYTEGHHIRHWADGGETKLDNLVTLCRYHHRELHTGSFFLSLKPETHILAAKEFKDDKPVRFVERLCFSKVDCYFDAPFKRSEDFVIAANPAKFTCACCDESKFEEALPSAIDEKTAVTKWTGESMDVGMAIDGLLSAGSRWGNGLN